MKASEVRDSFLNFFEERGHKIVRSAPVFPKDDPTLLFTNAGMNQFKDVFLGTGTRPYSRAVDSQKCIRVSGKHNDLEEVGFDTYHHTFFEMLGNWSFGDYYKEEAIGWAWELITDVWQLPKDRLYATVFREDDEAEILWKKVTDINPSHVMRFDEKDNFWEMGDVGPCGPCSEIHIDLGEGTCDKQHVKGHVCNVNAGCARFIELWNLVFIQYNRDSSGASTPLPNKHVDTGLGFERTVAVLQGKGSNYQTDVFTPLLEHVSDLTGQSYQKENLLPAFRVIADHIRTLTFAITDGALPSNDGRGYVLRRILRRGARYGRNLGMKEPFIYKLVPTVADILGEAYPEIKERIEHTTHVIKAEEERFNDVLDRGIEMFEQTAAKAERSGSKIISGSEAFRLYDTYGFPVDLTQLMAKERDLEVDESGFETELEGQRERARQAGKFSSGDEIDWSQESDGAHSVFKGYESCSSPAVIQKHRKVDHKIEIVLDKTPFYAEAGGQLGDTGEIIGDNFKLSVTDTVKQGDNIIHICEFSEGDSITGINVTADVDIDRRNSIARNHTATHLLHQALKEIVGEHVNQSGSMVGPDRMRFDFTHFDALSSDVIDEVESRVNLQIRNDLPLNTVLSSLEDAKAGGATALFGEKYDDDVRVVSISDYSKELCGGIHVNRTGEIGSFRIIKEEGIAAGVRRVEVITGEASEKLIREEKHRILRLEGMLSCRSDEIEKRVETLLEERKQLDKRLVKMRSDAAAGEADKLLDKVEEVNGIKHVAAIVEADDMDEFRFIGDKLRERLGSGVGTLGVVMGGKVNFLCVVTDDIIKEKKIKAGDIVREVAKIADGSGGGRPHFALAGGRSPGKVDEAVQHSAVVLEQLLKNQK